MNIEDRELCQPVKISPHITLLDRRDGQVLQPSPVFNNRTQIDDRTHIVFEDSSIRIFTLDEAYCGNCEYFREEGDLKDSDGEEIGTLFRSEVGGNARP